MRKVIFLGISSLLISLLIISCEKEKLTYSNDIESQNLLMRNVNDFENINITNSIQNQNFNNFAYIVSKALNDYPSFRTMVVNEALLRFDNDYDILLKTFKDKSINVNGVEITIEEFLNDYYQKLNLSFIGYDDGSGNEANGANCVDLLVKTYPLMQISVPVNIDLWSPTLVPIVTFIPKELNEGVTLNVLGYQNTNPVVVDAVNEPQLPIVVIGLNERLDKMEINENPPSVDLQLSVGNYQKGLRLSWTKSVTEELILGYQVFRNGNGSQSFVHIGNSEGANNLVYEDNTTEPGVTYTYYIMAYNNIGFSNPSNYVTNIAPNVSNSNEVASFNANYFYNDDVELRWTYSAGQFIQYSKLEKRVVPNDPDYKLIGTFDNNTNYYIDHFMTEGKKTLYKFYHVNSQGNSNPKFDFIVAPYRNLAEPSPVYIRGIEFHPNEGNRLEYWVRGAPEFKISVVKAGAAGDTAVIQRYIRVEFPWRICAFSFNNILVSNWLPTNWIETYTFRVFEQDEGPNADLEIDAGFDKKDSLKTNFITGSLKMTLKDLFNNADEDCGSSVLRYTDPPTLHKLIFPNYQLKLTISDSN